MSRTSRPRRRATRLWESSWITMQTKSAAIQMTPSAIERAVVLARWAGSTGPRAAGNSSGRAAVRPSSSQFEMSGPSNPCSLLARSHARAAKVAPGSGTSLRPLTLGSFSGMARGRVFVDLGPLRHSQAFRRLWAGYLVTTLGSQLTVVAIPYQVFRLTHSSLDVGLVGLAQIIPVLAGSLFGGSIADAVDRRRLLLVTQLSLAACSIGLALNSTGVHVALWPLYALSALGSGVSSIDSPTRSAVLATLVGRPMFASANALWQLLFQVGQVAGPAIAGLLLGQVDIASVYWIDAAPSQSRYWRSRAFLPCDHLEVAHASGLVPLPRVWAI